MMKQITKIDVQPMLDEIDNSLWEPIGGPEGARTHGKAWIGTEVQTFIRHVEHSGTQANDLQYSPCEYETPLDDLCLPGFRPTNALFLYPEAMKTLVWFATTYGGKYARVQCFRTPPGVGVKVHVDAQPDKFGPNPYYNRLYGDRDPANKTLFYYKKDRVHVIIDGSFELTVDYEEEDRLYEHPITSSHFVSPVTKVWSKGEVWWFNNKKPHKSYNHGNIPKINLVIDIEGATIPNVKTDA